MIWGLVALCVLGSFIFAGLEAGLMSVSRVRLRHHAHQGDPAARRLEALLARPERALVTVLIATNLLNIFAVLLSTRELVRGLGTPGYLVSLAVWVPAYLFLLQLLPKALFRRFPYRALAASSELLRVTQLVLRPLLWIGAAIGAILYPREYRDRRKLFVAREEVKFLFAESEKAGLLGDLGRAMIHNIVDFKGVRARDVMMPPGTIPAVSPDMTVDELCHFCCERDLEAVPVESADGRLRTMVDVFDIQMEARPGRKPVSVYQRPLVNVAEDEPAYAVLRKLRRSRSRLAAVTGGTGKTVGIVERDDLIRRLVSAG